MVGFEVKFPAFALKISSILSYPLKFTSKSKNLFIYSKVKKFSLFIYTKTNKLMRKLVETLFLLSFCLLFFPLVFVNFYSKNFVDFYFCNFTLCMLLHVSMI